MSDLFSRWASYTSPTTSLTWSHAVKDTDGFLSSNAFRIPTGLGGPYYVLVNIPFQGSAGNWEAKINLNGSRVSQRQFGSSSGGSLASATNVTVEVAWCGVVSAGDVISVSVSGSSPASVGIGANCQFSIFFLGDKPGAISNVSTTKVGSSYSVASSFAYNTIGATIANVLDGGFSVPVTGLYLLVNQWTFTISGAGWNPSSHYDVVMIPFVQESGSGNSTLDANLNSYPTQHMQTWLDLSDYDAFSNEMVVQGVYIGRGAPGSTFFGSILNADGGVDTASPPNGSVQKSYCAVFKLGDISGPAVTGARMAGDGSFALSSGSQAVETYSSTSAYWAQNVPVGTITGLNSFVVPITGEWMIHVENTITISGAPFATLQSGWCSIEIHKNGSPIATRPIGNSELYYSWWDVNPWVGWVGSANAGDVFKVVARNRLGSSVDTNFDSPYILGVNLSYATASPTSSDPDFGPRATGYGR